MHKMVRLSDYTITLIDLNKIEKSREYKDMYMIYTVDGQEYVTLDDYNMFIKE